MTIRKAKEQDLLAVAAIYEDLITLQEQGRIYVGWVRGVYPTLDTAKQSFLRGDLFVQEDHGGIVGAAIINQIQVDVYEGAPWQYDAPPAKVMVLHTLVINPKVARSGYGRAFVQFYEEYARKNGCPYLRMDTNEKNTRARAMYQKLGYREIGVVPCVFNGIPGVPLVLLEKKITD